MRCYRVDEAVHQGIPLRRTENGVLCVDVGDQLVLLDEAFSGTLLNTKGRVIDRLRACLDTGELNGRTLTDADVFRLDNVLEFVEEESINLLYGDLCPGEPYPDIVREDGRSPDALVLLETGAGADGQIEFMCNTFYEYFDRDRQRVEHAYSREFPPAGVTIIQKGKTPQGTDCYLLQMAPNSSIRIERTGELDGAPNVLTLSWKVWKWVVDGSPLVLSSPRRRGA